MKVLFSTSDMERHSVYSWKLVATDSGFLRQNLRQTKSEYADLCKVCETMKPIWINEVRENKDKTGYTVSAPKIPTMKPRENN